MIMDPIEAITPYKDSSFAMLLEAMRRDAEIHYFLQADLKIFDGKAIGQSKLLTVRDEKDDWFEFGASQSVELGDLDVIFMRKDPPFDMEYVYTTYILDRAAAAGALIVNNPQSLRDMNEKAYTAWFPECTPLTLITRSMDEMREFLAVPEISLGDKRILLINGEAVPYALARIPSADDHRGNLVMGAKGVAQELSDADRSICERVGPVLREHGVIFAGIDVIGDYMTEVNVTSPTGIRELDTQFDLNIAGQLFDAIETELA
jgi:glutathione synthase